MSFANEILDAIEIMVRQVVEDNTTKIYTGVCKAISISTCSLLINGKENTVKYYGGTPTVGTVYQVFIPFGNMSAAFIIVPGRGGGEVTAGVASVNGKTGDVILNANDVGALSSSTIVPSKTSQLDNDSGFVDAVGASTAAPVQSVNTKTGAVVLTQDDIGDGVTYVRTHNDFTDAAKQQINTNEDNIAMLDFDMEAAQGDITTLKGNVTILTTALQSKQDKIVGGASTITDDNLTANCVLVSDGNGKIAVSNVTNTELGYLDGVTSNVQTQLDEKAEIFSFKYDGNELVDTTYEEINAAFKAGKTLQCTWGGSGSVLLSYSFQDSLGKTAYSFQGFRNSSSFYEVFVRSTGVFAEESDMVPTFRTINNKALSSNITLTASNVGAVSIDNVTTTLGASTTKVPSEKAVSDALSAAGAGDMLKATYDPTGSVAQAGGIPVYVEANGGKIDQIKVNGTTQPIANKEVDITVPTNNNQLTNGAGYITASEAPVTSVNGQTGDITISVGIKIVTSASQPTDMNTGDFWYQEI